MAQEPVSDEMAKQLREAWFRYLDTIEPIRPALSVLPPYYSRRLGNRGLGTRNAAQGFWRDRQRRSVRRPGRACDRFARIYFPNSHKSLD